MKSFNDWPTWQRVIFTNAIAGVGAWIGLAESDAKLSLHLQVPIVVFVIAFMNVMLLGVAPRIAEQRLAGAAPECDRPVAQAILGVVAGGRPQRPCCGGDWSLANPHAS